MLELLVLNAQAHVKFCRGIQKLSTLWVNQQMKTSCSKKSC